MSKTIVNLTIPVVVKEVEDILETYPHHPYQQAFSNPDLRQSLIAYVLSRIPNTYITVEEEKQEKITSAISLHACMEKALDIEQKVRQGIEQLLCEGSEYFSRYIPEVADPTRSPSHWFG